MWHTAVTCHSHAITYLCAVLCDMCTCVSIGITFDWWKPAMCDIVWVGLTHVTRRLENPDAIFTRVGPVLTIESSALSTSSEPYGNPAYSGPTDCSSVSSTCSSTNGNKITDLVWVLTLKGAGISEHNLALYVSHNDTVFNSFQFILLSSATINCCCFFRLILCPSVPSASCISSEKTVKCIVTVTRLRRMRWV